MPDDVKVEVTFGEQEASKLLRVRFENSEHIWNTVVVDANELVVVDEETNDHFIAEYMSRDEFDKAVARFNGMIEYEILN